VLNKIDVIETDAEGTLLKLMVSLKNISFMDAFAQVQWVFEAPNLNLDDFFNEVYAPYQAFFTQRELEIIKEMMQGTTNKDIAGNLSISPHTVATHRKNILKKAQCSTANQLIKLCRSMGILSPDTPSPKIPS
jgi:DNA-binding CsgD family transcriptional regulator